MKKILALILSAVCIVSNLCVPVSAANNTVDDMVVEKEFNTKYAKYKAKVTFNYDEKTKKYLYKNGNYKIYSMELKNVPYMNQWSAQNFNGGLYKGTGDPTKSSSYTHKEWLRDSLYYDRITNQPGVGNACGCFVWGMAASFENGKIIAPCNYRGRAEWKENAFKFNCAARNGFDFPTQHGRDNPEIVINDLKEKGQPAVICVTHTKCPFTDNGHIILVTGIDENGNVQIKNPNDFAAADRDCSWANIGGKRHTSYINGYENSRTFKWSNIKKFVQWGYSIDGPASKAIRDEVDKWAKSFKYYEIKAEVYELDRTPFDGKIKVINPCKTHSWGAWKITRKATCTHKGEKKRVCSKCNDVEIKEIPLAHSYKTINNLIKCSKCNDVLFNPAAKPLQTELHQKNKYAFNNAQITTIAKLMVVNYKHNRDLMEASLSAALNCAESKGIKDTKKIANYLYNCFGGSNYIKKYNNSKDGVTNKDYLIVKYCITKGFRVFPSSIVAFDWKKDISYIKLVKVNGKTYKVAKNKYGAQYVIYKTVKDIHYGYNVPQAVKKAL